MEFWELSAIRIFHLAPLQKSKELHDKEDCKNVGRILIRIYDEVNLQHF